MNKRIQKLADTYTLQKITQAAGYTQADKEANNKPKTVMNAKFRIKNKLTKNNITKAPIRNRKRAYKEMEKYWDNVGYNLAKSSASGHLLFPPRQGLVWDLAKHRWVRPEMAGKTVIETQGKKRFREAGEKRLKSLGAKSKIAAIAARKKKLKAVKKKHKK